ncbi:hypothetical protein QQF64_022222 [Cirrhinus molitorella]|uniref:Uncharacterized protein n=1 Tax=Cirrhinus molitorella TaxID=172907 RepID=A0ABR3LB42_9TELE
MLDLHYDRLVSDGISSWAQAQGERGRVGPQPWPAPAPAGGWRGCCLLVPQTTPSALTSPLSTPLRSARVVQATQEPLVRLSAATQPGATQTDIPKELL